MRYQVSRSQAVSLKKNHVINLTQLSFLNFTNGYLPVKFAF